MIIEKNKVVSVNYILTVYDTEGGAETLVEETSAENPFVFIYGNGELLDDFEAALNSKTVDDKFDFKVAYERGYGQIHTDHIVNVPIDAFIDEDGNMDEEMVVVGNMLPMHDQEGNKMQGLVTEITEEHVRMDFNHPLAGKNLHFVGEVLEVRPASLEELSHGHVHGLGGNHH